MSYFKWKMESKVSFSFWKGDPVTLTVPDGRLLRKPDEANASINVQKFRRGHQTEKVQVNTYSYRFSEARNIC